MTTSSISIQAMTSQLQALGVQSGSVLLVHTAFSKVKPVEQGPLGLIAALEVAVGPAGTLVMPTMSWDDDAIFDPKTSPCREEMGIVADTFWRMPHVLRNPTPHAFAAKGRHAAHITQPQPLDVPHGLDSPVGRVYDLDGYVLLLGVGHTSNTTIHLGEWLSGVRYRRPKYLTILQDGKPMRFEYGETDHCCENFALVDAWLDERSLQRKGIVGHAEARLMRSQDVITVVTEHLRINETAFLHPFGIDEECDEARASIP